MPPRGLGQHSESAGHELGRRCGEISSHWGFFGNGFSTRKVKQFGKLNTPILKPT